MPRTSKDERPPAWLRVADLAALLSTHRGDEVTTRSILGYIQLSKSGRYESHPFPEPDDRFGRVPVWLPERAADVTRWDDVRVETMGHGGRPAKDKPPEGLCPVCGRSVALDEDGHVATHKRRVESEDGEVFYGRRCDGSGQAPKKSRARR